MCEMPASLNLPSSLARSPLGGYLVHMTEPHRHASHPAIIARLKRADGHLRSVIEMIETGRSCVDVAQQLAAVEKAVTNAKRALIHDHLDHCLDEDSGHNRGELREIAKYL